MSPSKLCRHLETQMRSRGLLIRLVEWPQIIDDNENILFLLSSRVETHRHLRPADH